MADNIRSKPRNDKYFIYQKKLHSYVAIQKVLSCSCGDFCVVSSFLSKFPVIFIFIYINTHPSFPFLISWSSPFSVIFETWKIMAKNVRACLQKIPHLEDTGKPRGYNLTFSIFCISVVASSFSV